MSLFLTEWLTGPSDFMFFADMAWQPIVQCYTVNELEGDGAKEVRTKLSFFEIETTKKFIALLGPEMGRRFANRLDRATEIILKKVEAQTFVKANFLTLYNRNAKDLEKTSEELSFLFDMFLMDYEFWNKTDLIAMYTNIIFYGMIDDPKPYFFTLPPLSQWDEYFSATEDDN